MLLCALPLMAKAQIPTEMLGGRTLVYGEEIALPATLHIDPQDNRPLETILGEALLGTGIDYRITSRHILLYKKSETPTETSTYAVHGHVTDATSQETLIGANIYCPALRTGAVTNAYGFYTLPLPEGRHMLVVSYVGYESRIVEVEARNEADGVTNISLEATRELQEVVVESDRPETGVNSTRMSAESITIKQIEQTPSLLGEADVVKALHILPGVQTGFAGTSQMSVRGGNLDQNLFLMDGVQLYNAHHVLGFESAFMPDAVKHVDFFAGSFPARFGGRLSSVADVRTKDGDMQQFHGHFSLGLLTSHIGLEGPIVKGKTSFIVSARRSYAGWLMRALIRAQGDDFIDDFDMYFYDINAKVNHKFGDRDRIYLHYYRGQDGLNLGETNNDNAYIWNEEGTMTQDPNSSLYTQMKQKLNWGNNFCSFRWNHVFTPSLFSNLTLGYNRYKMSTIASNKQRDIYQNATAFEMSSQAGFHSGIEDLMMIYDFDWHPAQQHHLKMGGSYTHHTIRPEVLTSRLMMKEQDLLMDQNLKGENATTRGNEFALYAEDDMTLGSRWQMNAGLRAVAYGVDGKVYPSLEPRWSASYLASPHLHVKGSYTMMHQYVHQLTSSPLNLPTDLWVSVTRHHRPMTAQQWAVGATYDGWMGWELSAEAYWKEMRHVLEYIDGASFYGSSRGWESKVTQGEGRARGLELTARRTLGKVTGMIGYTLSKTDRRFPDGTINNGRRYPYEYDRRHKLQMLAQYQITPHVDLNASWNLTSGGYGTIAYHQIQYIETETNNDGWMNGNGWSKGAGYGYYYSGRSNYRIPPRHQLDLGINIHHKKRHGERIWNFSIINAYAHHNPDVVYTDVREGGQKPVWSGGELHYETETLLTIRKATIIPILPSASYTYRF